MTEFSEASGLARRNMLKGAAALMAGASPFLAACGGSNVNAADTTATAAAKPTATGGAQAVSPVSGLGDLAVRKGMYYGAAVKYAHLSDAAFVQALTSECGAIVPDVELKWGALETTQGTPDYSLADSMVDLAIRNGLKMRGHTAAWHLNIPKWASTAIATEANGIDRLYNHVTEVVSRYKGRIFEWDVVNEAVEPKDNLPNGLRNGVFYKAAGGPDYIANCFHAAHAADPAARLTYNEWGLDYTTTYENSRRLATLKLLESLKAKGAPVHALGIQAHLKVGNYFDPKIFETFLADVASLGLKIVITELDIDDQRLVADVTERDQKVAEHATTYLDVVLAQPAVTGIMTWGLSDRYSWLNTDRPRADGLPHRSLPLDADLSRKSMWQAMADGFAKTSVRRA